MHLRYLLLRHAPMLQASDAGDPLSCPLTPTATSCQDRYTTRPYFMGSGMWGPQFAQGGLFDDKPAMSQFATANLVYVACASRPLA